MKLWIFGDSFAELKHDKIKNTEWQIKVSSSLKCDLYNIAYNGASSEWLTLQLSKNLNQISFKDKVIFMIPYWDRQCIFPDNPDFNQLHTIENNDNKSSPSKKWLKYSIEERDAFKKYFMHLYNESLAKLKTSSLYAWINNLQLEIPPLVIETREQQVYNPVAKNYKIAKGNLIEVSISEWIDLDAWNMLSKYPLFVDPRTSHLHQKNHNVLSDKIVDYFKHQKDVDLTTDFYKGFLNKDCVDITDTKKV